MNLVAADGALLERIFDLTYPIWHEGLTRRAYAQWNRAQMRLPWARDRFHRLALLDEQGELLASLKRYRFDARVHGRSGTVAGLGAVFTPPDRRGRGHARTLIERVLEQERAAGSLMAALFSEIGTGFYGRLGFSAVKLDEVTVKVTLGGGGTPAVLVRTGDDRDLGMIAAMHDVRSAPSAFALRRDPAYLQFAMAKKRLFAGLSPPGLRQVGFFVTEEGSRAVA